MRIADTTNGLVRILIVGAVLAAPAWVYASGVQSTTTIYLSFRDCIAGESVCDHFERPAHKIIDGLPGSAHSQGELSDPEFGSGSASATLTEAPGGSTLQASVTSMKGKRSGASAISYRKFVNEHSETVTLEVRADVQWQQTVPDENATIPRESPGKSGAAAYLIVEQLNIASIDAGTSVEENFQFLLKGVGEEFRIATLGDRRTGPLSNVSEEDQQALSVAVTLAPGEHIWVWTILQSFAANGAAASADMSTRIRYIEP
ncbi:MAG: hypothetical protein R3348_08735 [Xanthomonadales bacterium]|nr:hypothetical protein [Xanthomonadales bacterium]